MKFIISRTSDPYGQPLPDTKCETLVIAKGTLFGLTAWTREIADLTELLALVTTFREIKISTTPNISGIEGRITIVDESREPING